MKVHHSADKINAKIAFLHLSVWLIGQGGCKLCHRPWLDSWQFAAQVEMERWAGNCKILSFKIYDFFSQKLDLLIQFENEITKWLVFNVNQSTFHRFGVLATLGILILEYSTGTVKNSCCEVSNCPFQNYYLFQSHLKFFTGSNFQASCLPKFLKKQVNFPYY